MDKHLEQLQEEGFCSSLWMAHEKSLRGLALHGVLEANPPLAGMEIADFVPLHPTPTINTADLLAVVKSNRDHSDANILASSCSGRAE